MLYRHPRTLKENKTLLTVLTSILVLLVGENLPLAGLVRDYVGIAVASGVLVALTITAIKYIKK